MITNIRGDYTPITEDVTISGTRNCDGKVIGVAYFSKSSDYIAILFYTSNSLKNYYGLKVIVKDTTQPGLTSEWFYD